MRMLVNIDVPDIPRAVDFYCAALDLQLARILDGDVAELTGGAATIYLLQNDEGTPSGPTGAPRTYARHWTPVHVDFVVEDLAGAIARAEQAGAKRESECVRWRGSRCVTFSDPFGNGFCLIEFEDGRYSR